MQKFDEFAAVHEKLKALCTQYQIRNYHITRNNKVNVEGSVWLGKMNLDEIPIPFGQINGDFDCSNNNLTSLKNCPFRVMGSLYVYNNSLTSLDGCAESVGMNFNCSGNNLLSLYGGPMKVGKNYNFSSNIYLPSLGGITTQANNYNGNNNKKLPEEIQRYSQYMTQIIHNQYKYSIWNGKDLNVNNFHKMMKELLG